MTRVSDFLSDDAPEPPRVVPPSSLEAIFAEEPVSLTVFVTDKRYLANPPLSADQYDAVRHIERVFLPPTYELMAQEWPYWSDPVRMVNFVTLQWGKGSGKDHVCRIASLRVAYLLQCLHSPQLYYGMPEQDTVHLLNVASSSSQANQAFFIPMTRAVKRGWFADHCHPKPGLGLISWNKNVEMISGHADAESQEGLNLILGLADEVDAFKSTEKSRAERTGREPQKSVESILKMLRGSAVTRFPESFKNVRISYPRYLGSPIQKLTAQARADNLRNGALSRHYVSGPLLTWQVNPRYAGFGLVQIPQSEHLVPNVPSILEDYSEDAAMARSIYECAPARAVDSYYRNMEAVRACVVGDEQPVSVSYQLREFTSEHTGRTASVWEPSFQFDSSLIPIQGANYAVHADLAIRQDAAGIAMSHVSRWIEDEQEQVDEEGGVTFITVRLPVVTTDFVLRLEADLRLQPAREIQIAWARQLCFELIRRGFNLRSFTFDGFQSEDSLQILARHSVPTGKLSTDKDESLWKTFRDVAYSGRWRTPYSERLFLELESLGRFAGRVDHPPSGSKDEADAVVCSMARAIIVGGEETGERAYPSASGITTAPLSFSLAGYSDHDYREMPLSPPDVLASVSARSKVSR